MQAEERRTDNNNSEIQGDGPSPHDTKCSSKTDGSENSDEFNEESGHKPARNMMQEDHAEDQMRHIGKRSVNEQHDEMEHEQ